MKATWIGSICALALVACGGGDDNGLTSTTSALTGVVYEVDGQTVDRGGVTVMVVETGDSVVTAADGSFGFTGLEPGSYTLDFETPFTGARLAAVEEGGTAAGEEGGAEGEHQDGEGRPRVTVKRRCGKIEIRVALANGEVKEFTIDTHEARAAKAPLFAAEDVRFDIEGRVLVTAGLERELLKFEIAPLPAGTVVEIFLDARNEAGPVSIGTAIADGARVATMLFDTGAGDVLPLGATGLDDLAGHRVEVRFAATGTTILVGEIPDLPAESGHRCEEESGSGEEGGVDKPAEGGDLRARALLESDLERFEGHVEIRCWEREEMQRFRMDLWGLEPGDRVAFEIYLPREEAWVVMAFRVANEERFVKIDTDGDLAMPLGVKSVKELVGLAVRIRRASEADDDTVLAYGIVPEPVQA